VHLDPLTLFGLFSVSAMLVFYALEDRNKWFILAFAGACLLGSAYGFLQELGHSVSSKQFGQLWRRGGGGLPVDLAL